MRNLKIIKNGNIFLIGSSGSGKSTIGMRLSKKLNKIFFDSDLEIEKKFGSINEIFKNEGEREFRRKEKAILKQLTNKNDIVLSTGGGCIYSKTVRHLLCTKGLVVYLKITIEQQLIRVNQNQNRPLLVGDSIRKILEEFSLVRSPLYEKIADLTYCTDRYSVNDIIKKIFNVIQKSEK